MSNDYWYGCIGCFWMMRWIIWLWYELSVDDNVDYLLCCELSICVYLDNELNCFKLKQLGP